MPRLWLPLATAVLSPFAWTQTPDKEETGQVVLASVPPDASVFLDGQLAGTTSPSVSFPPGIHTIRVESPGHGTWERTWELDAGDRILVTFPGAGVPETITLPYILQPPAGTAPSPFLEDQATIPVNPGEENRPGVPLD